MSDYSWLYYYVGNIPRTFHSYDLRAFFSHLIEKNAFPCFHFRHRPEYIRKTVEQTSTGEVSRREPQEEASPVPAGGAEASVLAGTLCCILKIEKNFEKELKELHNHHWVGLDEDLKRERVKLRQFQLSDLNRTADTTDSSSGSLSNDISSLPEMNPPKVMPQGNVGTSLETFRELIKSCHLPPQLIKKLKLGHVLSQSRRMYGAVSLDYEEVDKGGRSLNDLMRDNKRKTHATSGKRKKKKFKKSEIEHIEEKSEEESDIPTDDDFDAEDWERYEALHDDVDKQGRTSERLFEEEMEVVWDKGSSGLVFYTDANYWDELDGDFDEKCSQEDDWDVDMSLYYGYESADKTAHDLRDIEIEKRLRSGDDIRDIMKPKKDLHKGYGGRLMKEKGWREGDGLGKGSGGISEPLEAEGQLPTCKTGLGYRGDKISWEKPVRKPTREVLISTIYDQIDEEEDTIHQSATTRTLKYRNKHRNT